MTSTPIAAPAFAGQYAFGTLQGFLAADEMRREVLSKMQERFGNTAAVVGIPSAQELRTGTSLRTICASNPYLIAAYSTVGEQRATRAILPQELEQLIAGGKWRKGVCYADIGLVLDFSGRSHALALNMYEQLPADKRTVDSLPLIVSNLHLAKMDAREGFPDYLRFVVYGGTQMHYAPALAGNSGYFAANDLGLLRCGVPERVVAQKTLDTDRYFYTVSQNKRTLMNIGIARLCLYRLLDVYSSSDDLAFSNDNGRVVPVDSVAVVPKKITLEKKRTFMPLHWLDERGQNTEVHIDETMSISAQMPEQYQRKMKIVEALQGREDLTEEETQAVEEILRKMKKD